MLIETERFGSIKIDPELIFTFKDGIPGFPKEQQFVLLSIGLEETPFIWMQSLASPHLCFLLVDPLAVFNYYEVAPSQSDASLLQCRPGAELQVLCMVSVPEGDLKQATVNLRAPLWFNSQSQLALQSISENDSYGIRYPLFAKGGA